MSPASYARLHVETPLGPFALAADEGGLRFCQPAGSPKLPPARAPTGPAVSAQLETAARALRAYFAGEPDPWQELRLAPEGTEFQHRVWEALRRIPYGRTLSYRDLARSAGQPRAARAVGQANHHNPLAIVVPCHRVVAADGGLGGYAGGLAMKRWLLEHEGALRRSAEPARQLPLASRA